MSVLLLLEELSELLLEVLGVVAHLLVELVGVLLDHLLELLVVLLHLGGQSGLVGLIGEELLVLLLHLLRELGVEAVELVGELLEGGAHCFFVTWLKSFVEKDYWICFFIRGKTK